MAASENFRRLCIDRQDATRIMHNMRRFLAILFFALFVGGGLIIPAMHRATGCQRHSMRHCADTAHGRHGPEHASGHDEHPADAQHTDNACPICQLAATAFELWEPPSFVPSPAPDITTAVYSSMLPDNPATWSRGAPPTGPPAIHA